MNQNFLGFADNSVSIYIYIYPKMKVQIKESHKCWVKNSHSIILVGIFRFKTLHCTSPGQREHVFVSDHYILSCKEKHMLNSNRYCWRIFNILLIDKRY